MQSIGYPDRVETQFFTAPTIKENMTAMDRALAAAEQNGGTLIRRAKIGRNATCPCGSGRKFKKCCINRAQDASA